MTDFNNEKEENGENNIIPFVTDMAVAAIGMKEMFDSWLEAGFTESQAIELLAKVLADGARNSGTD